MAAAKVLFLKKNRIDAEYTLPVLTASEGTATIENVRDRSNRTAWQTVGSTDASGTTVLVEFGETRRLTDILLIRHNFKAYTIQYYDDDALAYANFSTPISETVNTDETTLHQFTAINTTKILLTISGTQVANAEKTLYQFIATERLGRLAGWPQIKKPRIGREVKTSKMLSGKSNVVESVGFYSVRLSVTNWSSDADLAIVESLYDSNEGFLIYPSGGNEAQFSSVRQGYRLEDIFLVRCTNDYNPEFVGGFYRTGLKLDIDFTEVLT